MIQCHAVAVQYSTVQYNAVKSSTVQCHSLTSMNPLEERNSLKSMHTPDWMRNIDWFAGVRRSTHLLLRAIYVRSLFSYNYIHDYSVLRPEPERDLGKRKTPKFVIVST